MKKILYVGFWPEHKIDEDHIYLNALKDLDYIIHKTNNISEDLLSSYDNIICGSFLQNINDILIIGKFLDKVIYNITEPVEFNNPLMYKIYSKNLINLTVGCVKEQINNVKYPHYMDWGMTEEKIIQANNYITNFKFEDLFNKKFCCLINRHDLGKTRTEIYEKLKIIDKIDCPGNLFNNYPNDKFEKIGRTNFQKEYLFSICPENFNTKLGGYVTEKLFMACISVNIPIYFGDIDDIDKKIFNVNRIIFFNPSSKESINNAYYKILQLMSDFNKLYEFYTQPIFCDTAIDTFNQIKYNFKLRINNFINNENYNYSIFCDLSKQPNFLNYYHKINGIDHIVWINLDRSLDRKNNMEKLLKNVSINNTRISAIDGKSQDFSNFNFLQRSMTNYEIAVTLSHIKAYSFLNNINGKYFMVLEDDINFNNLKFFNTNLDFIINNAPEFDILLLHKIYEKPLNLYERWNTDIFSTASYIISKNGINKLLKLAEYNNYNFYFNSQISIADYFLYNQLNTWVYKYNFISTNDETSIIHPEHLDIHKKSSNFQYNVIFNDLILS